MLYVVDEVRGVTYLGNIAYVVCGESPIIKMYTADTLSPLGEGIHVKGMKDPRDIVACRHDRQLYISELGDCIWRVSTDDQSYVKWLPTESATGRFDAYKLSMTSRGLLVTSLPWFCTVYEYSTDDGHLLRVVQLPEYMELLSHAIETSRGTFVVCHQGTSQDKKQWAVSELFCVCTLCPEKKRPKCFS